MEGVGGGGGGADITLSLPAPLIVVTGSIWRFPYVNQCWPKTQDDIKQFDKYHVRVSSVDWKRMLSPKFPKRSVLQSSIHSQAPDPGQNLVNSLFENLGVVPTLV